MIFFHGGMFGNVTNDFYKLAYDSTDTCVICQDLLLGDDEIITLECAGIKRKNKTEGHSFHVTCMEKYAEIHGLRNLSCPMCRRPLNQEELKTLQSVIQPNMQTDELQTPQPLLVPLGTLQEHTGVGTIISIDPDEFQLYQDTMVDLHHNPDAVSRIQNSFVITGIRNGIYEIESIDGLYGQFESWSLSVNDLVHIITPGEYI